MREMQIRTRSRYLVTVVRMVTIRNLDKILEWMWRKGNPPILFVRMKTDTATMKNSVEMSLKTGSKTTTCCAVLRCSVVSDSLQPHGLWPTWLLCPWRFPRKEYQGGLSCPPPGDLPNPGIKAGLPYCRQIRYCLSHQESP